MNSKFLIFHFFWNLNLVYYLSNRIRVINVIFIIWLNFCSSFLGIVKHIIIFYSKNCGIIYITFIFHLQHFQFKANEWNWESPRRSCGTSKAEEPSYWYNICENSPKGDPSKDNLWYIQFFHLILNNLLENQRSSHRLDCWPY